MIDKTLLPIANIYITMKQQCESNPAQNKEVHLCENWTTEW